MNFLTLGSTLTPYLVLAAFLFGLGLFALAYHRTLIGMLIAGELVLAAASLNFMAFGHFLSPDHAEGQVVTLFIMGLAAAEAAIVLSVVVASYRQYRSVQARDLNELKG